MMNNIRDELDAYRKKVRPSLDLLEALMQVKIDEVHKDKTDNPLKYISICSGIGGLDKGVDDALIGGATPYIVCDKNDFCQRVLDRKYQSSFKLWTVDDVIEFDKLKGVFYQDSLRLPRSLGLPIVGGYPCQPFSPIGKRKGVLDERFIWPQIKELVGLVQAPWVFFENVKEHLKNGFLDIVKPDLEELGYEVRYMTLDGLSCGVPMKRKRLFIYAFRKGKGLSCQDLSPISHDRVEYDGSFVMSWKGDPDPIPGLKPTPPDYKARCSALGNACCSRMAARALNILVNGKEFTDYYVKDGVGWPSPTSSSCGSISALKNLTDQNKSRFQDAAVLTSFWTSPTSSSCGNLSSIGELTRTDGEGFGRFQNDIVLSSKFNGSFHNPIKNIKGLL
jgi:site-specific DNA-cytosine methylase